MADATVSTDTAPGAPESASAPAGAAATTDDAENKAIARCMRAWNYAYKKKAAELDGDDSDYPAQKAGALAYLRATPPLVGYKNICDFVACINYGSMTGIVKQFQAEHYLANAKIALSAVLRQPKPFAGEPRPLGRPPKPSSTEEK